MSTANTGDQPQNIYDDPDFFAGYKTLRRKDSGLNGAIEIPALRRALPDLSGLSVLDLGCGFGDFARYARSAGAKSVLAVDVSARMLEDAARQTDDPDIRFERTSIEDFVAAPQTFDVVVSSLALHYIRNYAQAVERVHTALRPRGRFIFTVEHPLCTADPRDWIRNPAGDPMCWPVDRYQDEGARDTTWFVPGVIKYHRTVSTYLNTLIRAGFRIATVEEPGPTAAALSVRPSLQTENRRPPFLLVGAERT